MSYSELVQRGLSLVVAIWDEDSRSRDDYMAGFRATFPPNPIPSQSLEQIVQLKHQEPDGHPAFISFTELVPGAGGGVGGPPASPYPGAGAPYPGGSPYPGADGPPGGAPYPGAGGAGPQVGGPPGHSGPPGGSPYPGAGGVP